MGSFCSSTIVPCSVGFIKFNNNMQHHQESRRDVTCQEEQPHSSANLPTQGTLNAAVCDL
jgi:hypothetical protein